MHRESAGHEASVFSKKPKKPRVAEGTDPGIKDVQAQFSRAESVLPSVILEDDFSEEVTKVFKREPSQDVKDSLAEIRSMSAASDKESKQAKKEMKARADKNTADIIRDIKKPKTAGDLMHEIGKELEEEKAKAKLKGLEVSVPFDTKDSLAVMRQELEASRREGTLGSSSKETKDSLAEVRTLSGSKDESEEMADLQKIRASISKSKKPAKKSEVDIVREIMKPEIRSPQIAAEAAQAAYSKAYIEYDPKYISKLYKGKKSGDVIGAYDLAAVTRPPRLAFLTSKGRELNRLYKDLQDKTKAAGAAHDQAVEKRQVEVVQEEREWEDAEWEARRKIAKE